MGAGTSRVELALYPQPNDFFKEVVESEARYKHDQMGLQIIICNTTWRDANVLGRSSSVANG